MSAPGALSAPPPPRRLRSTDVAPLAAVFARAFFDDPSMRWLYPSARRREAQLRRFFMMRMRVYGGQGESVTTEGLLGGAVWAAPERWEMRPADYRHAGPLVADLAPRLVRSLRAMVMLDRKQPEQPHWYLAVLATDPPAQGRGIASALLRPVLDSCDSDGIGAYLETSTERNVAFYARHGFRVTEELALPKGPPVWLMWRDPR